MITTRIAAAVAAVVDGATVLAPTVLAATVETEPRPPTPTRAAARMSARAPMNRFDARWAPLSNKRNVLLLTAGTPRIPRRRCLSRPAGLADAGPGSPHWWRP